MAAGRRVLTLEGEALTRFAGTLDTSFAEAVGLMLGARGRVIVSGMGKSGHVARKIAATLASTGTPSQFVHPAEASHGDLGMVTRSDVVLLLSNSGETTELADLIEHTRRFHIPLIGVASRPESTLLRAADVALHLPRADEACPNGLAPTTSTTLTMALGDALAVALMETRDFRSEHFHVFHPAGRLGQQLVRVSSLMHSGEELPIVTPDMPMSEALIVMTQKGFGALGVVSEGRLAGVITDGDLRRNMAGLLERRTGDVMNLSPTTISPESFAAEAMGIMNARSITTLFVVGDDRAPIGILHVHDCLRAGLG
ncbi:SIS domain-containing protein [Oceanicella sp. SM1341]|uniref:KpsF/GutQ family sugar-phosphate isomerase n=1 Tax=Oceanicella sp. SM1341 TaxID=1548889 RepID=UPI000E49358F|nr:KpsF/GutQ family sugar-phosphate isomerase [Oceanicella sp. SM1341]